MTPAPAGVQSSFDDPAFARLRAATAKPPGLRSLVSPSWLLAWIIDPACMAAAALCVWFLDATTPAMPVLANQTVGDFIATAAIIALLASFILRDIRFDQFADTANVFKILRSHALRFSMLMAVLLAMGTLSNALTGFPPAWVLMWVAISLFATSSVRLLISVLLGRLRKRGMLCEAIAIVGVGRLADQLTQQLCGAPAGNVELLGVFADSPAHPANAHRRVDGTLADLIELGKTRNIDSIILAMPASASARQNSAIRQLKALAVPVTLCPEYVGSTLCNNGVGLLGGYVEVGLAERADERTAGAANSLGYLPRWIATLLLLPVAATMALGAYGLCHLQAISRVRPARRVFAFDGYDLESFIDLAATFGSDEYGYVVTPNADHMIRLEDEASFRALYASARYVLLDSRFLAHLLRLTRKIRMPVCTGSDLTARLFQDEIAAEDTIVIVGGTTEQVAYLCSLYGLKNVRHHNPPMGFIRAPEAVEDCLRFIESHSPFRFCLLAVGSPQQEVLAYQLKVRGVARGLALCIGASINFLTGDEKRAPLWMQRAGIEWSYRLLQSPGRMAKRYLVRGPRVFALLRRAEIVLRAPAAPAMARVWDSAQIGAPALASRGPAHDLALAVPN